MPNRTWRRGRRSSVRHRRLHRKRIGNERWQFSLAQTAELEPFVICGSNAVTRARGQPPGISRLDSAFPGKHRSKPLIYGAGGGNRTLTALRPRDFESRASASFTTPASETAAGRSLQYNWPARGMVSARVTPCRLSFGLDSASKGRCRISRSRVAANGAPRGARRPARVTGCCSRRARGGAVKRTGTRYWLILQRVRSSCGVHE